MVRRHSFFPAVVSTVAGILILASGCADLGPTAVQLRPATALSAARAYQGGTYTAIIGTEGGKLNFGVGTLTVPAGAVTSATLFTASVDGRTIGVEFGPHGLSFPQGSEPHVKFDFQGVRVNPHELDILYTDDFGRILEEVRTEVDHATASGSLRHFSKYVLAVG